MRDPLGNDRIAMVFGELVVSGGIHAPRHHLGQALALEIEKVAGRKSFPLKIGRAEQSLGTKQGQGLLTFGSKGGHISDSLVEMSLYLAFPISSISSVLYHIYQGYQIASMVRRKSLFRKRGCFQPLLKWA